MIADPSFERSEQGRQIEQLNVHYKSEIADQVTRRGILLTGLASAAALTATPVFSSAPGYLRGSGHFRRLKLSARATGESIDAIYWIDGNYILPVLDEINFFMRDWRAGAVKEMDRRNLDFIAATHLLLDTSEPFTLLSGYRTAKTNAMLRRRSRRVARNSLHVAGKAADLGMRTRSTGQIARAARSLRGGGVGTYRRPSFVHIDSGDVRSWNT